MILVRIAACVRACVSECAVEIPHIIPQRQDNDRKVTYGGTTHVHEHWFGGDWPVTPSAAAIACGKVCLRACARELWRPAASPRGGGSGTGWWWCVCVCVCVCGGGLHLHIPACCTG